MPDPHPAPVKLGREKHLAWVFWCRRGHWDAEGCQAGLTATRQQVRWITGVSGWRSRFFLHLGRVPSLPAAGERWRARLPLCRRDGGLMGSVIKKRRKRMAKKKHRKLLKKTRIQRRNKK